MIRLDGRKMTDRQSLHAYLQEAFGFPETYGGNLDALWDNLSVCDTPTEVLWIDADAAIDALGEYGQSLLALFQEVEQANRYFRLQLVEGADD